MISRSRVPAAPVRTPSRFEALQEVAHRSLEVGDVAGEHETAVDAVCKARGLRDGIRAALADVSHGYKSRSLRPGWRGRRGRTGRRTRTLAARHHHRRYAS